MTQPSDIVRFGGFRLDRANRLLLHGDRPVELGSRYFDALVLLVDAAGALVTKDRFMDEVWRGIPVTDEALTQCIRTLRRALDDDAAAPQFIQTVPRHGYRFIAPVAKGEAASETVAAWSLPGLVAGAVTVAGGLAGAVGGLFYGVFASTAAATGTLVLCLMVAALGTLAGAGVGLGLAIVLAWRARADALLLPGGAIGGMAVGALGAALGTDGIGLLTGVRIGQVTGPGEGLILGLATGVCAWLVLARPLAWRRPALLLLAGAAGGATGLVIHASGGRMLGASLAVLQHELGRSHLVLDRVGQWMGEETFGRTTALVTASAECAVFVIAMTAGLLVARSGEPVR